jgi:glyoxylase-like metal-dependent hydrolase (beta-lactamase superfamily II)
MTELTRRAALAGAAVSALAPFAAGMPARAAAPQIGKQAPGVYRYKVGAIEVSVVTDGSRNVLIPDNFIRNVSKDDVNKALQASFFNDKDRWPAVFNPVVVNTGSKLVVIDTGLGPGALAGSNGALGQFHGNLAAGGIDRNAVDMVIISHYHGDHIGGLLNIDGTLAFPNAEVTVPAKEHAWWMDDGNINGAPAMLKPNFELVRKVFKAVGNKLTQYSDKKELVPGITAMETLGHTMGHMSHVVSSGSQSVLIQADITYYPAIFAKNPGWQFIFDMDGPRAEATRRKVYDQLAADKMMVQGYHYPFPSNAYIEKDGAGYRAVPAMWSAAL